jgi:hypothetical protein
MSDILLPASRYTPHLGLALRDGEDLYVPPAEDVYPTLDLYPGLFICTSETHPTNWTVQQAGMWISEQDTGLTWRWDGSQFHRTSGLGVLSLNGSTPGPVTRATNAYSTSTNFASILTAQVTIPPGGRPIRIEAQAMQVDSVQGMALVSLWRGATQLSQRYCAGTQGAGSGVTFGAWDAPAPGLATYSLQLASGANEQQASIYATPEDPMTLTVVEY